MNFLAGIEVAFVQVHTLIGNWKLEIATVQMAIFLLISCLLLFCSSWASDVRFLKCAPDVCRGVDFDSIGLNTLLEVVPKDVIKSEQWYDQERTKKCFSNKYVLLLGDSSLQETVEELNVLLNGTAKYFGFVDGHEQHRNQIIQVNDIQSAIRFRWFGHRIIENNFGGVASMMDQRVSDELNCLLGLSSYSNSNSTYCRRPDIIIVQSSHHDVNYDSAYGDSLPDLMELLKRAKSKGSDVYWKGSGTFIGRSTKIDMLNEYAAKAASIFGIPFINMTEEFRIAESFMNVTQFFDTYPHVGMNGHDKDMTFSNFLTQRMLREICSNTKVSLPKIMQFI